MTPFYWGVFAGLLIGVPVGFAVLALMVTAGRSDEP